MITTYAVIRLLEGDNEQLKVLGINTAQNPKSAQISSVIGSNAQGSNPFMIGVSKLNSKASFKSSVPYYIGRAKADENGIFPNDIILEIEYDNSSYANNLTIVFDTYNNQYPTEIDINGKIYYNDDPIFTVANLDNETKKQIKFNTWNTPNYPVRIQSISIGLKIEVDKRNMLSYNGNIQDRADFENPSWGIISNTGELSFIDKNDEVADYANDNLLNEGLKVDVFLKNTLNRKTEKIGTFETDTWNYESNNREVSVSLQSDLVEWQNINISGIDFDVNAKTDVSAKEIYDYLWSVTPLKYNMNKFEELNEETKFIINNTIIRYKYLKPSSLWNGWQKLCMLCQLKIYKTKTGETTCKYNRGN